MTTHRDELEETKDTGRVEAFSDGVFAIAITLLVLDIHVPQVGDPTVRGLPDALGSQWPIYLAYVSSFLTVLIMWINHHNLMKLIKRNDHTFLLLNGLLLMGVTVVAFPTALLAEWMKEPDANVAALVYSGTFVLIALFFNLLWFYASRNNRLLDRRADPRHASSITRRYMFGPLLYSLAFLLAFVNAIASVTLCIILAIFFALPNATNRALPGG